MQEIENPSLEQIQAMLEKSREVEFRAEGRSQIYAWVEQTLQQQEYGERKRAEKGLLRRYIETMTGLSRAQVTRLIGLFQKTKAAQPTPIDLGHSRAATPPPMWHYWRMRIKSMGG